MKDRITWVPSLLTGELIPKKISDPDFLRIIEPYLTSNPTGLSADTLRSISRSDKDIEYGTVVRQYNTSGNGHSFELKADPITKGQAP